MTKCIDFYFDFISPYSYLAFKKIKSLQNKDQINFNYKPILLGGLHNLGGVIAPAFNERKMKNMKNDCELIAKKNNIDFEWNINFPINSLYLMRGYIFIENEIKEKFFEVCFDAYWKENLDISQSINLNKILDKYELSNFKGDLIEDFSSGMIKRSEIAIADLKNPDVLCIDEPKVYLDENGIQLLLELLKQRELEGNASILSSQESSNTLTRIERILDLND